MKPVKKSKVAQENTDKSDVAKTGTSRWWHKWIPSWFSSSSNDNKQAEVENTLDEYGNPKVEEVDSDDEEALNEPIKNDGNEGKAIVRTAPKSEKNQPLIKVNIPKSNPDREQVQVAHCLHFLTIFSQCWEESGLVSITLVPVSFHEVLTLFQPVLAMWCTW